jgi:arylsulfatase A-like enzyme
MTEKPNILVIVVDCLRSDRVLSAVRTCKTPNIDKLVEGGTSVPNVFVENSITAPSFATLFTGRYAGNHGVIGMVGVKLDPEAVTLADIFSANGYNTYAEMTGPLTPLLGTDRGFSEYNFRNQEAYSFTDWGKELVNRLRTGGFKAPYFLVVHFWEVHVPRQIQPEFDSPEFGETPYDRSVSGLDSYIGELIEAAGEDAAVILTADHGECVHERPAQDTLLPYFLRKLHLPPLGAEEVGTIDSTVDLMAQKPRLHAFTEELAQIAKQQGHRIGLKQRILMMVSLLAIGLTRYRLQLRKGIKGNSTGLANLKQKVNDVKLFLAVAMGNPEAAQLQLVKNSLNEHSLQHGYHIYDYLQRVPAVFTKKGIFPQGQRLETEVRHIDFLPTLIQAFGLETSYSGFDGSSYYELMANGTGENRSIYLEARGGAQAEKIFVIRGVRRNGQKLAYAPFEPHAPVEYYNLRYDPMEQRPLADPENEKVAELREEAEAINGSFGMGSGATLSAKENVEMVRKLQSLGYM